MKSTFLVAALVFGTAGAALAQPPPSPAPAVNLFGSAGAYDGGDNQDRDRFIPRGDRQHTSWATRLLNYAFL